jgi:hypothetical protein
VAGRGELSLKCSKVFGEDHRKQVNFMHSAFVVASWLPELQRRSSFAFLVVAIILGIAAVALVGLLYAKEAGRLGILPRLVMAAVRMAIVAIVAFLLIRPVVVLENREERSRPIGILIDVSQSMSKDDARPNTIDQWRTALAFGLVNADKGIPTDTRISSLRIPERPQRIEIARKALTNPKIDLFKRLFKNAGPLEVYTFGSHRRGRDWLKTEWLEDLVADESQTALVESAFELLNRDDADAPAALVLVTDGRDNASTRSLDDLARECSRRKIPVYVYGVGSSSFGQLQVKDALVPETIFVDDLVSVPVRYSVKGIKEGRAEIVLSHGGREVARKSVPVREREDIRETLSFVPTKEDAGPRRKQELTATVTITASNGTSLETYKDEITRPAQVIDKKLKVLVIDSLPRFDFKFLQRALLRDRRVDAMFYLTDGDKAAMRSGPPWMIEFAHELNGTLNMEREEFRKILFGFDLLILGAVPAKFFSEEQQKVIQEFVTEGGGLIHIAGRSYSDKAEKWTGPAAWAGGWEERNEKGETRLISVRPPSPIGELLPVEFQAERMPIQDFRTPSPFVPVLAPAAARNPIVTLEDDPIDNGELWGKFPSQNSTPSEKQLKPLYWYYPVLKTKPAADVFLVHPTDKTPAPDNKPMPLMVGHYYGKGYVLFIGFDDTWRWRFNTAEKLFGRFWSQAIYAAGLPRTVGTKLTQLSIDNPDPILGKTAQVYARVFNEKFKLLSADEIDATLEKVDAEPNDKDRLVPIKLHKLSGQDGEYIASLPFNKVGRFRLTVDPKNKTPAALEYRVNLPPDHELAPGGLDEEAMRNLCEATGGKFYREEDLYQLPNDVKRQTTISGMRKEWLLWNGWVWGLLIVLLTLEWFLRKFNGLS